MASIRSISVRDFSGATNIGGLADLLNITLTLDEAVTVSNGTINLDTVRPSFFIGNQPVAATRVSFLSYNPSARSITYQLSLPLNIYDTKVTLTGLALNQITISGAKGALTSRNDLNLMANYTSDSFAPTFTNPANLITVPVYENSSNPVGTFAARDNNHINNSVTINRGSVQYGLSGSDASWFNVDSGGVLRFKAAPDYERKNKFSVNIIATDRAGNSALQAVSVKVNDVNEAVTLAKGVSGVGTITVLKGDLATQGKSILADFVIDGDNPAPLSFKANSISAISAFSVANGSLSGIANTAGSYRFTVKSNDGLNNGNDASRSYVLNVVDKPVVSALTISDSLAPSNSGSRNALVSLQVILSESVSNPSDNAIQAQFRAGKNALSDISFTGLTSQGNVSVLNFTGSLPAGDSNSIVLTSLNLASNNLVGVSELS